MRSAFFEFNIATSALFVARGNLETTSHNVANSKVVGYSRQYAEQRATWPMTYYDGRGMVGTGAEIYGIGQMRNFYLDTKMWSENAVLGEYQSKNTQMGMVEKVINEMSATGNTSGFNLFFETLQGLSTDSFDDTYRTNVLQASQSLTKYINSTTESLKKQQRDINEEVKTVVSQINSIGQQIGSLNSQIQKFEMDGSRANDLRDSRARLVDELSLYVNVEVRETEKNEDYANGMYPEPEDRLRSNKEFSVMINGSEFVNGQDVRGLETVARDQDPKVNILSQTKRNPMDISGLYDVYFTAGGGKFDIYHPELQGQLKGLIDSRDGNNALYFRTTDSPITITPTLKLQPDASMRTDLKEGESGEITFTDANNQTFELYYSNVKFVTDTTDPDFGKAIFTIDTARKAIPATAAAIVGATVGKTTDYKGVTHYLDKMNELVRTFTKAINEGKNRKDVQISGVTGYVNGLDSTGENNGNLLFTYTGNASATAITDYNKLTCENFTVNSVLIKNPGLVQAAKKPTDGTDNSGVSQNGIILEFLSLRNYKEMFAEGKINDYIGGMAGELGVDVLQAKRFEKNYDDLTVSIDNQRKSVSGVDLNEEMANMVKYQQLYQAAAKLLNIIDGIYDTTINRLGLTV